MLVRTFFRSHDRWDFRHTAKFSLSRSEILATYKKSSAIVSELKKVRTSIKLAGSAQTLFLCGDSFESTPIVRDVSTVPSMRRTWPWVSDKPQQTTSTINVNLVIQSASVVEVGMISRSWRVDKPRVNEEVMINDDVLLVVSYR
jgi:hypothetical protein